MTLLEVKQFIERDDVQNMPMLKLLEIGQTHGLSEKNIRDIFKGKVSPNHKNLTNLWMRAVKYQLINESLISVSHEEYVRLQKTYESKGLTPELLLLYADEQVPSGLGKARIERLLRQSAPDPAPDPDHSVHFFRPAHYYFLWGQIEGMSAMDDIAKWQREELALLAEKKNIAENDIVLFLSDEFGFISQNVIDAWISGSAIQAPEGLVDSVIQKIYKMPKTILEAEDDDPAWSAIKSSLPRSNNRRQYNALYQALRLAGIDFIQSSPKWVKSFIQRAKELTQIDEIDLGLTKPEFILAAIDNDFLPDCHVDDTAPSLSHKLRLGETTSALNMRIHRDDQVESLLDQHERILDRIPG